MTDPLSKQSQWVKDYQRQWRFREQGRVMSVGDGIAWISGLPSAAIDDVVAFDDGSRALVFDLAEQRVGAILLHDTPGLTAGARATLTARQLGIGVGDALLGRVVDPTGLPLDGSPLQHGSETQLLYGPSPPVVARDFVHQSLFTGIKIIDTMIPIGKGQRELIVGDEGSGRSAIALDTVINQREQNVRCVYVLIGQKRSTVINVIEALREQNAMQHCTVVVAEASSLPGLQHLAPFAGCAIAEYWMNQGYDTLVVYDDLATHARAYRELSLLLRRPPGREAYPGDIFSVHASLLERATCLHASLGGGSMTAMPIVETQQGEIASYIPTNLISMTDGQIYLDRKLLAGGFHPAIDIGRSVSRIGGHAQHGSIRREAGRMKLNYLQFLELETFTRFGTKLESSMEQAIQRGRVLRQLLKQDQYAHAAPEFNLAWLIGFNDGLFDDDPPADIPQRLAALADFVSQSAYHMESPRGDWSSALAAWHAGS